MTSSAARTTSPPVRNRILRLRRRQVVNSSFSNGPCHCVAIEMGVQGTGSRHRPGWPGGSSRAWRQGNRARSRVGPVAVGIRGRRPRWAFRGRQSDALAIPPDGPAGRQHAALARRPPQGRCPSEQEHGHDRQGEHPTPHQAATLARLRLDMAILAWAAGAACVPWPPAPDLVESLDRRTPLRAVRRGLGEPSTGIGERLLLVGIHESHRRLAWHARSRLGWASSCSTFVRDA